MLEHRPRNPDSIRSCRFHADTVDRNEFETKFPSYVSAHPASRNDKANPRILGKYRQELFCSFWRNWYCASPYRLLQYRGPVCSFEADYTSHSCDRVDDEPYLSQLSPDSPLREMSLSLPIIFSRKRVLLAQGKSLRASRARKQFSEKEEVASRYFSRCDSGDDTYSFFREDVLRAAS